MGEKRITELKTTLGGELKRFDCGCIHLSAGYAVVSYRMPKDVRLEDLLLPEGTLSLGYFWEGKPYTAYHWVGDKGETLALYFNICDSTRISDTEIAWRDLTVDVLMTPDRRCRVLDEDELPDDLDEPLRDRINATRDRLCADPARWLDEFDRRSRVLLAGG